MEFGVKGVDYAIVEQDLRFGGDGIGIGNGNNRCLASSGISTPGTNET